ncbi:membrane protein mmpS4 [Mycolicibacter heraklionensis]|uniref:Membrane protein mmpS4 n=1 Tax=Mycolicibacter heraklionensis TaxID=512402 RepID=A0A9X7WIA1_9MYCO|nr:MmpS family transport accessory protein [Mycolicibacter heraklionensis]KLO29069.1 membrane protein mmpS4 [Mycolicibacter heraklionensis]QZA07720.1 MmpS family protein [Mycolicibacter heraklionensis]
MSPQPRRRSVLARVWMPLVAVIALSLGALSMWKVHQMSAPGPVLTVNPPQAPEQFNPKKLTYEVFGSVGDGALLSYLDINSHPHTVELDALPWTHDETTMLTVVSGSISVQVRGDFVGCRILVDDVIRDEHTNTHANADVTCRVKSA